jgi:NTE family protein
MRIGLALGGGSARGLAHIGIIDALLESGIRIDAIAGTSIGALIGAGLASGHYDRIREFALSLNARKALFSICDPSIPISGLMEGKKASKTIARMLEVENIEDMKIPFCAVCCDHATGERYILDRGPVINAIKASISIPGLFEPLIVGGRILLDGGIVEPVPVRSVRELGADFVIAVDLNHFVLDRPPEDRRNIIRGLDRIRGKKRGMPDIFRMMMDGLFIMERNLSLRTLKEDPPDILLQPKIGDIGFLDYYRAKDAIAMGRECALEGMERIRMAMR